MHAPCRGQWPPVHQQHAHAPCRKAHVCSDNALNTAQAWNLTCGRETTWWTCPRQSSRAGLPPSTPPSSGAPLGARWGALRMLLCGLALFSFFLHSLSFPRCQPKEAGLHQTCQMRHVLLPLLCLLGLLCRSSSSRSWPRALSLRAALITAQTSQVRRRPALPALPAAHMEVSLWPGVDDVQQLLASAVHRASTFEAGPGGIRQLGALRRHSACRPAGFQNAALHRAAKWAPHVLLPLVATTLLRAAGRSQQALRQQFTI